MKLSYEITEHGDLLLNVTVSPHGDYGNQTKVWQYATIEEHCIIGHRCVIGSCVFVGSNSRIGDGTRIQHGAFICRGAKIGQNVFIGPLAILTDDKYPVVGSVQPHNDYHYKAEPPTLEDGCSIGAGAIILPGVRIGRGAMVGAGAVVTHDVEAGQTVTKVPAEAHTPRTSGMFHPVQREGFGID